MSKTMLFNPYSGRPRDPRDIQSDPEGILRLDPDEPLLAAAPTPPAEAVTCSNAALQAFQRFADYDAKTDCYVVQADDLRPAIDAALAAKEQP
mgnify:CR=1 FL=1